MTKNIYQCKICSKQFSNVSALGGHSKIHSKIKIVHPRCSSILTKQEVSIYNLEKHETIYLKNLKQCKQCDKTFSDAIKIFCSNSCAGTYNGMRKSFITIEKQRKTLLTTLKSKYYPKQNIVRVRKSTSKISKFSNESYNKCHNCDIPLLHQRILYCKSDACQAIKIENAKVGNAYRQSKYRAKKYRVLDPSADKLKIKEIYANRPNGYEVDHIIPLSKGGKHHEDNLQYLLKSENRAKGSKII